MTTVRKTKASCQCKNCQSGCKYKPGWFLPGEAEKVAEHLGISIEELFRTKLGVDWFENWGPKLKNVFVLSPALIHHPAGQEFPGDPRGECVFYEKGKCSIHEVKPFECREMFHTEELDEYKSRHKAVADAWAPGQHQAKVKTLLGHKPKASYFSWLDELLS